MLALFGLEQPDGSVKKVNRSGLRAALADGYGDVPKSTADCCLDTTPFSFGQNFPPYEISR